MKMRNVVFCLVLVVGIAFSLIQGRAWGYGGVENPFGINPKAPGIQYSGPFTVYFRCVPDKKIPCRTDVYNMYFFMRLSDGKNLYFYSYDAGEVPYDNQSMLEAFQTFIETKFIPDICSTSPCPTFENGGVALKSVTNHFYDLDFPPGYFIADIVIAVIR